MVSFPFFPIKEAQGYHNNRSEISPNLLHKSGIMRGFSNGSRAFPRDQSYPLERTLVHDPMIVLDSSSKGFFCKSKTRMDPWDSFGFHFLALSGQRSEQKKHNNFFGFDDLLTIVNNYITDQPSICGSQHKIKNCIQGWGKPRRRLLQTTTQKLLFGQIMTSFIRTT